mgnify:CR=1 FL=1
MDFEKLFGDLPIGNGSSERPEATTFLCVGATKYGCEKRLAHRSGYCQECTQKSAIEGRLQQLKPARRYVSPDGALDWCMPTNPDYLRATSKLCGLLEERAREVEGDVVDEASIPRRDRKAAQYRRLANEARLPTATLGALIVGPRRIGKSKLLAAIGIQLLEQASRLDAPEDLVRLAMDMRFINGIALARAAMDSGGWKNSPLYHEACTASLLLLDETGYEETKSDQTLIRDILRMRYEVPFYRPTVMASGATVSDLNNRYGEAAMSTVWERGIIIDLHPSPLPFEVPHS